VDLEELKTIIALLKEQELTEITISQGEDRITVRQPLGSAIREDRSGVGGGFSSGAVDDGQLVRAPLVGTFYRRRAPDEPPLVEPGDRIHAGDVLCIVEAMKVMNEVAAERSGILRSVLVDDGAAVEFGEPLFRLEAA